MSFTYRDHSTTIETHKPDIMSFTYRDHSTTIETHKPDIMSFTSKERLNYNRNTETGHYELYFQGTTQVQ